MGSLWRSRRCRAPGIARQWLGAPLLCAWVACLAAGPVARCFARPGGFLWRPSARAARGGCRDAALLWAEGQAGGEATGDWREFRARLVLQERAVEPAQQGPEEGWAHELPAIEQGSVVLSAAGDHFALSQHYLHKSVILIIRHGPEGDVGLILNRPTAFAAAGFRDVPGGSLLDLELGPHEPSSRNDERWNVWFGGDCQGVLSDGSGAGQSALCLHTLDSLAEHSEEIIKGVFLLDYPKAQSLLESGAAGRNDFLLLVGYCAWLPGHLQSEVDRGDTWALAAAEQRLLLGELQQWQADLGIRLQAAAARVLGRAPDATDVGNGVDRWERLYRRLAPKYEERWAAERASGDDAHVDEMLNLWVQRCLVPAQQHPPWLPAQLDAASAPALVAGAIFWGSATAWLLGKPAEEQDFSHFRPASWRPHQYLHKAVLLLLQDVHVGERSNLVILNGPKSHTVGPDCPTDVYLGGTRELGTGSAFELGEGSEALRVEGYVSFRPGILEKLISLSALNPAPQVQIQDLLSVPPSQRWEMAGGSTKTAEEARLAALGDEQRRKWYSRFFGRDVPADG